MLPSDANNGANVAPGRGVVFCTVLNCETLLDITKNLLKVTR